MPSQRLKQVVAFEHWLEKSSFLSRSNPATCYLVLFDANHEFQPFSSLQPVLSLEIRKLNLSFPGPGLSSNTIGGVLFICLVSFRQNSSDLCMIQSEPTGNPLRPWKSQFIRSHLHHFSKNGHVTTPCPQGFVAANAKVRPLEGRKGQQKFIQHACNCPGLLV